MIRPRPDFAISFKRNGGSSHCVVSAVRDRHMAVGPAEGHGHHLVAMASARSVRLPLPVSMSHHVLPAFQELGVSFTPGRKEFQESFGRVLKSPQN